LCYKKQKFKSLVQALEILDKRAVDYVCFKYYVKCVVAHKDIFNDWLDKIRQLKKQGKKDLNNGLYNCFLQRRQINSL
jgi:beta-glucosidase/6-phospho-beta-glucosidase/beta-galactosidase